MAVVTPEGHNIISRVPARCEQSGGRQRVPVNTNFSRVETGQDSFSDTVPDARAMSGGPLHITREQPTGSVCELEARTICHRDRCTSDQLDSSGGICLSPFRLNRLVPSEDQDREMYGTANCPMLEDSTLVSSPAGTVGGFPNLLPQHKNLLRDPSNQPQPQKSLSLAAWKVSGDIRLQLVFQNKLQNCWQRDGARA